MTTYRIVSHSFKENVYEIQFKKTWLSKWEYLSMSDHYGFWKTVEFKGKDKARQWIKDLKDGCDKRDRIEQTAEPPEYHKVKDWYWLTSLIK